MNAFEKEKRMRVCQGILEHTYLTEVEILGNEFGFKCTSELKLKDSVDFVVRQK